MVLLKKKKVLNLYQMLFVKRGQTEFYMSSFVLLVASLRPNVN